MQAFTLRRATELQAAHTEDREPNPSQPTLSAGLGGQPGEHRNEAGEWVGAVCLAASCPGCFLCPHLPGPSLFVRFGPRLQGHSVQAQAEDEGSAAGFLSEQKRRENGQVLSRFTVTTQKEYGADR